MMQHTQTQALGPAAPRRACLKLLQELCCRERHLATLSMLMLLACVPTLIALGLDERQLRGVSAWVKPLKFMLSVALFAGTTAWFVGLLPPLQRHQRAVRVMVWTRVGAATLDVGYISWQAGLGAASHYNVNDTLHAVLYQLTGAGAMAMMRISAHRGRHFRLIVDAVSA